MITVYWCAVGSVCDRGNTAHSRPPNIMQAQTARLRGQGASPLLFARAFFSLLFTLGIVTRGSELPHSLFYGFWPWPFERWHRNSRLIVHDRPMQKNLLYAVVASTVNGSIGLLLA
jgi:hypothetical protein